MINETTTTKNCSKYEQREKKYEPNEGISHFPQTQNDIEMIGLAARFDAV